MILATWNVNSVRARKERLLAWLSAHQPDVLCLQELKVIRDDFPWDEIRAAGYEPVGTFQPTYNGVAILSRLPLADVVEGLGDGEDDPQARFVAATVSTCTGPIRVVCVYVPNGQEPDSDKYAYKLRWLARLEAWLRRNVRPDEPLVICGDFNIVPRDSDAHDAAAWNGTVLLNPLVRARLQALEATGLVDVVAVRHPEGGPFSWWDYRMLGFQKNHGLRIDLVLATPTLAARCTDAFTDRDQRKGEKPSDHAPVVVTFQD
jgi:exodeoxyribonuclease-3